MSFSSAPQCVLNVEERFSGEKSSQSTPRPRVSEFLKP